MGHPDYGAPAPRLWGTRTRIMGRPGVREFGVPADFDSTASANLALQQVDGFVDVGDAEVIGERGVLALDGEEHLPGDAAVGEGTLRGGAQLGDVDGLGEVHFEE